MQSTRRWLNRASLGLATVLIAASQCTDGRTATQTAAAPAPVDARKWGFPQEIAIDLAPYPDGGAINQNVPPGTTLLVRLWNRPPARVFRIEAQEAGRPPTQHEIPAAPGTLVMPTGLGPECADAAQALGSLFAASRVEEADRAKRAHGRAAQRVACPQLDAAVRAVYEVSHVLIPGRWQVGPGEEIRLTIRQIAPGGDTSATWNVTLTAPAPTVGWSHANEQEWMAAAVVGDIVGLLSLASGAKFAPPPTMVRMLRPTASGTPVVRAEVAVPGRGPFSQEATLEPNVLAPSAYRPLALALAQSWQVRVPKPEASVGLVDRLTDLRASTLKQESTRVGVWLSRRPLDPAGNEEAALIHLALALRESAGRFTDLRPSLARATAHLAVADLAGAPRSVPGRIARDALLVLTGRQVEVLPSLQAGLARPNASASERAWARALILRVTDDWRLAPQGQPLTLLERLQLFRARRNSLGGLLAVDMFASQPPEPLPDWSWVALPWVFTAEEGNASATSGFPATLSELATTVLGKDLEATRPEEIASLLRPDATSVTTTWSAGKGSVQVLDRATWTAFFARHLANAANAADEHLRSKLGLPGDADAFAAQVEPYLRDTPWSIALGPLRQEHGARRGPPACTAFVKWVKQSPQTVPAMVWYKFLQACGNDQVGPLPPMMPWFAGPVVPGTVLGLAERTETGAIVGFNLVLASVRALAPYDEEVARVAIVYGGKRDDPKTIAEVYGPKMDYSLVALGRLAHAEMARPAERRPILEQMCKIAADECVHVAEDFAEAREDGPAVEMYEKALAKARNRVLVSNEMDWLAAYYFETGKPKDAERVARAAAEVGSSNGLVLLGTVLERQGRLSEAESVFKFVEERYNNRQELDLFYARARRLPNGEAYEDPGRRATERIFPKGLERVGVKELSGAPTEGVLILEDTRGVRDLGLAKNDVIVALDGYRTRDLNAYRAVRGFRQDQKIELIAWSTTRRAYVEAQGRFRNRRFGSTLQDFRTR